MNTLPSSASYEPIAVIGMSCRFPGADTPGQYWNNIRNGIESRTVFTREELLKVGVPEAVIASPDCMAAACTIAGQECFDAAFFGYSPHEARLIDPQQRVFLECAWHALENAGYIPRHMSIPVGVFGGARLSTWLYALGLRPYSLPESTKANTAQSFQALISNDKDYLTSRTAYKLNLTGPALTVQTACSTSLVAVHLACQSLQLGECDMALAGGVALLVPQAMAVMRQEGMILSPQGHCRPFDAGADGTIFGHGAGVVALKRLDDALEDNDTVYAVIKGSAVTNDGNAKAGFTAPGFTGQAAAITEAIALAGINAESIGYVETHGTGTILGDPIEIAALSSAFRQTTDRQQFCHLGSAKANIGHLDTAAGIASFMKAVMAVNAGEIPPLANFSAPNPHIDFASSPFTIPAQCLPWPASAHPRRAGVSSFGIGGTNCHMVLEQAPLSGLSGEGAESVASDTGPSSDVFVLSARTRDELHTYLHKMHNAVIEELDTHKGDTRESGLHDFCFTSRAGRTVFPVRFAATAASLPELAQKLKKTLNESRGQNGSQHGPQPQKSVTEPQGQNGFLQQKCAPVLLFTGQGAQCGGMGKELYASCPTFARYVNDCAAFYDAATGSSLTALLFESSSDALLSTELAQPALFALEYALGKTIMDWGVEPLALMGHSVGEYVAACLAGVMPLADAMRLVITRGRLMQALPETGGMLSVFASEETLRPLVEQCASLGAIAVAAFNAPDQTVMSGAKEAVVHLMALLTTRGITYKELPVSHAFHSSLMDPMLETFHEAVAQCHFSLPRIPVISNVSGCIAQGQDLCSPEYWVRHLRSPVQFMQGLDTVFSLSPTVLLEVGPKPVLGRLAARHPKYPGVQALPFVSMLDSTASDVSCVHESLCSLFMNGASLLWDRVDTLSQGRRVPLPGYPFARTPYGPEPYLSPGHMPSGDSPAFEGVRGRPCAGACACRSAANTFSAGTTPAGPKSAGRGLFSVSSVDSLIYQQVIKAVPFTPAPSGQWVILGQETMHGQGSMHGQMNAAKIRQHMGAMGLEIMQEADGTQGILLVAPHDAESGRMIEVVYGFSRQLQDAIRLLDTKKATRLVVLVPEKSWDATVDSPLEEPSLEDPLLKKSPSEKSVLEKPSLKKLSLKKSTLEEPFLRDDSSASTSACMVRAACASLVRVMQREYAHHDVALLVAEGFTTADQLVAAACTAGACAAGTGTELWVQGNKFKRPVLVAGGMAEHPAGQPAFRLDEKAGYLITGGSGGIAPSLVLWLACHGVRHIVLASRSTGQAHDMLAETLTGLGVSLYHLQCDMADPESVRTLFADTLPALPGLPCLKGIFHLAGALADIPLAALEQGHLQTTFEAKVFGLQALLPHSNDLDFIYAFSSLSGVFGAAGQGAYAAANAALDAFCADCQRKGMPVHSIRWGAWDLGMARSAQVRLALARAGMQALPPATALACLEQIMMHALPDAIVVQADKAHFAPLAEHQNEQDKQEKKDAEQVASLSPEALASTPLAARAAFLEGCIAHEVQTLLQMPSLPEKEADLISLGLDSLVFLSLSQRLSRQTGLEIPPSTLFAHPSVALLASHLDSLFLQQETLLRPAVDPAVLPSDTIFAAPSGTAVILGSVSAASGITPAVVVSGATASNVISAAAAVASLGAHGPASRASGHETADNETTDNGTVSHGTVGQDTAGQGDNGQDPHAPFRLTDVQYAYWVGRSGGVELGNISCHTYFELEGEHLDIPRLERAWNRLITRHDMLRCVFLPDGTQQILSTVSDYHVAVSDLAKADPETVAAACEQTRQAMADQVHDALAWPLFELRATTLPHNHTRLHISLDLLIADFHSITILMHELEALYLTPDADLAPLGYSFRQYVSHEEHLQQSGAFHKAQDYWRDRLVSLPSSPRLPLATHPGQLRAPKFVKLSRTLAPNQWEALKKAAAHHGVTPSCLLLSVYADVLALWSNSRQFCINLTLFNRKLVHDDVMSLVGDFTSTSLLEIDARDEATFGQRTKEIQSRFWRDMDHRDYSGIRVIRDLHQQRGSSPGALMPVVFTANLGGRQNTQSSGTLGQLVFNASQTPQVWLDYQVFEEPDGLAIMWDYVQGLFPQDMPEAMFEANLDALLALADNKDLWDSPTVLALPAAQAERRRLYNPVQGVLSQELLHSPLVAEKSCSFHIIHAGKTFSYPEVIAKASAMSKALQGNGVTKGSLVGLCLPRGPEQILATLGTLLAGGAYVPMLASWPTARVTGILDASKAVALVSEQPVTSTARKMPTVLPDVMESPEFMMGEAGMKAAEVAREVATGASPAAAADQTSLAYVIFTSGSTGTPKGVAITHQAAMNTIADLNSRFALHSGDRILGVSELSFDLSVYDIFGALHAGAGLVLPEEPLARDPSHWHALITAHDVTIWNSAPQLLCMLVEYCEATCKTLPSFRLALLSGDWIPVSLPQRIRTLAPNCEVISLGGATEASIWSIYHPVQPEDGHRESIPYGRPLDNQSMHVLNDACCPVPEWVTGDLYIGGAGLAEGYLGDEPRTSASFFTSPVTGERLYRTGDMARFLPENTLEFMGRSDHQVKIRGYRVELGEIETVLERHLDVEAAVVAAVVVAQEEQHKDKRLVAYVKIREKAGEEQGDVLQQKLHDHLAAQLPSYMLPSAFVLMQEFPLTSNGKIDRKFLPAPGAGKFPLAEAQALSTPEETMLAKLWENVLRCPVENALADFFALGGDSLLAGRLVLQIRAATGTAMPLGAVFEYPVLHTMAEYLHQLSVTSGGADGNAVQGIPVARTSELETLAVLPDECVPSPEQAVSKEETPSASNVISAPSASALNVMGTVFLTGSTGFLGGALLEKLLVLTESCIICLVRASTEEAARQRLLESWQHRWGTVPSADGLPPSAMLEDAFAKGRVSVVAGSLEAPLFGMQKQEFALLAEGIDTIIHCGAKVQYAQPYMTLAPVNVEGTLTAVRLALAGAQAARVMYVSTSAVLAGAKETITEQTPLTHGGYVSGGYAQSKWVAERLLQKAAEKGLSLTVFRPGTVSGDSRTGFWNTQDFPCRFALGCAMLGMVPDIPHALAMLPVDSAAEAIIRIAQQGPATGQVWNMVPPQTVTLDECAIAAREYGVFYETVSFEQWKESLLAASATGSENPLEPLLPLFPHDLSSLPPPPVFSPKVFSGVLASMGMELPSYQTLLRHYTTFLFSHVTRPLHAASSLITTNANRRTSHGS